MYKLPSLSASSFLLLWGLEAAADPMILVDHQARTNPRDIAVVECAQAMKRHPILGKGLILDKQVQVVRAEGSPNAYILSGTTWSEGVRTPVSARCVTSPSGRAVARLDPVDATAVAIASP